MDCGQWTRRLLHARPSAQTPIVSMGTTLVPDTDTVQLDLANAFRQATEHLAAQGCRRIAYLSNQLENDNDVLAQCYRAPRLAYQAIMKDVGLEEEYVCLDVDTRAASRRTLVDYVKKHGCPDGILCRDDEMAIGAYRAICDLGLRIGRDVLLIGCNGSQDTQYLECPLSTITLPVPRMCQLAWQFLERRMADPSAPLQHAVLEAAVAFRESSARCTRRTKRRKK
jgi:LacI family transcriptional regulator